MLNNKISIENIPNYTELKLCLRGYFNTDTEDINNLINQTYETLQNEIAMLPLRFFSRFIDEKASLFSNSFERQIKYDTITDNEFDLDELTVAEMYAERYYHLFKKSAIKIDFDGKQAKFLALDPTMYFYDEIHKVWYIKVSDTETKAYVLETVRADVEITQIKQGNTELSTNEKSDLMDKNTVAKTDISKPEAFTKVEQNTYDAKNSADTGYISYNATSNLLPQDTIKVVKVYKNIEPMNFEMQLETMDYSKTMEDNNLIFTGEVLDDFPFVEWNYYRIKKAVPHEMAKLQRDYISLLSWGFYNIRPKLLTQIIVKSNEDTDKLKQTLASFGSTTTAIKVGVTDEIQVFDTGTIQVLTDSFANYTTILEQASLHEGVDKNAIVSRSTFESGEAKKVELGYINKARNNFKLPARLFEKEIINKLNNLFGFGIEYKGIVFHDLELASDPVNDLEYATAMFINHFWTYEQAYAFVNKVSLDKAKVMIEEYGLIPPETDMMREQASDSILKKGVKAPPKVNFNKEQ